MLLLTGAAGGLGAQLLDRLTRTDAAGEICVLAHRAPVAAALPNVTRVSGDITAGADLGLPPEIVGRLSRCVTAVLHAAADTRFQAERGVLARTNVDGVRHMLEFAARCVRLERFCLLSTVYVAGRRTGTISEDELEHDAGFVNAYERSKYDAERLARGWMARVPLAVVRVSTVVGPQLPAAARLGAIHHAIRLMYRSLAPMVPGRPEHPVDFVPAAYAVDAICRLATDRFEAGRTYQICGSPDVMTTAEVIDATIQTFLRNRPAWRKRAIAPPALVDLDTFDLFRRSVDAVADPVLRDSTAVIGSFAPQLAFPKVFDATRCRGRLHDCGVEKPPVRETYVRMVESLMQNQWGTGA